MELAANSSIQREQAYTLLRRLLILQQLPGGQRLREPEWAARLNVHRTALREAFARLEAEGLIERGPQTGYFVPVMNEEDLIEINKLRLALETHAIDEVCARVEDEAALARRLAPMQTACEEQEQFISGGYSLGLIEADRRYHEALIDAAGSKRLSLLYCRAPLPLVHRQLESAQVWHENCTQMLAEHRQIYAALMRRDARQAGALLHRHVKRSLLPICH